MKSEIAVTRRTTYRVEENVVNLEKSKKKQDTLIDSMNEEIKRLNEQKTLYQAQLISQKEETAAARNTQKEADIEIERIEMSKKMLLEDWQKAIFGMQQRDNALQQIKELIQQKTDEINKVESEIRGFKNETAKEQQISEDLAVKLNRCEKNYEAQRLKQEELIAKKKLLSEEFNMLKQSLRMTEEEKDSMDKIKNEVEAKQQTLEKAIMELHTSTKAIRDDIISYASQQKTVEKSSANLLKQAKNSYEGISKKEVAIEGLVNEISRVRIDNLNAGHQNEKLNEKLAQLEEELKNKEKDVKRVEDEIKVKHTNISKRQLKVDRLNKEWAELAKHAEGDETMGPMENQKKAIEQKVNDLDLECLKVQKDWITNQSNLIQFQTQMTAISDKTNELQTKETIMHKKKMRLN